MEWWAYLAFNGLSDGLAWMLQLKVDGSFAIDGAQ